MEEHLTEWEIVIRLTSPLQVGAGTLGMVEKSELFIPGRLLWAVLTAHLTRFLKTRPLKDDYDKIGAQIGPWESAFSSLFPSFDYGQSCRIPVFTGNRRVWYPAAVGESGLKIESDSRKSLAEAEIENLLLSGLSGNATDPRRLATSSGSLHETDLISPVFHNENNALVPLMFIGCFRLPGKVKLTGQVEVALDEQRIIDTLAGSRLGGGRKRGWGQIKVERLRRLAGRLPEDLSRQKFGDHGTVLTSATLPVAEEQAGAEIHGRAQLATYREHSREKGSGGAFSRPRLCWQVGTLIKAGLQ